MSDPFGKSNLIINRMLGRTFHNPLGRPIFFWAAKQAAIGPDSMVLDVGTGRGYGAIYIAQKFGCQVTGIDISPTMIAEANNLALNSPNLRVRFRKESLMTFRRQRPFDLICCFDVLGFVPHRKRVMKQLASLTRRNGWLCWSDYFYRHRTRAVRRLISLWNLKSIGPYDLMRTMMQEAGFTVQNCRDTSGRYRRYWEGIQKRLLAREVKICQEVGRKQFVHYRAAVDAILDATAEGSFGHIAGIAQRRSSKIGKIK